jgi:hypothetical protein
MGNQIKPQNMIVNFICVLVKPSKGINLVISAEGDGRIHQASRSLA